MKQLTNREKVLVGIVGGILFVMVNLFLVSRFMRNQTELRQMAAQKTQNLEKMEALCKQRDSWVKKDAWLTQNQPKLINQNSAGVQLLDLIKENAKRCDVVIDNVAIGVPAKKSNSISVPVSMDTKSSWESLIRFLTSVQQPNLFIVMEKASLQIDPADQTQMHGSFKIARWYAAQ
jgi:hypothetical protein